ncbi:hypothetical protein BGX30_015304 [Mortierella sp. GBA39]|nr:hypothetical protein BGX30_015304 [Mortierella sp. GBA39]
MSYYDNSTVLLDCIATDPTSITLYGITNGLINGKGGFLLVKSLPNPDQLSLGMWSRVSFSQFKPFSYWKMPFGTVDCTVSSKGVFTAFFRNKDYISPKPADVPVGIRYDPETETWTSIRTSSLYGWDTDSAAHISFYADRNGVDTLVHMFTDDEGSVIRFGVLSETKKYLQLAGVWNLVDGEAQTPIVSTSPFYDITTIFDGNTTQTNDVAVHDNFVALGGPLPGQTPYVVGLSSEGVYQFSTIGKNGTNALGSLDVVIPGYFRGTVPRNTTMENIYYRDKVWAGYITKGQVLAIIFSVTTGLFCCIMYSDHRKKLKRRAAEKRKEQERQYLQQQQQQEQQEQQEQYIEMDLRGANTGSVTGTSRQHYHYHYRDDDDDDNDHLRGGRWRDRKARVL